jgi:uncharacterized protein YceK
MRKILLRLAFCLLLGGCATQAQIDAADDAKCVSYGARPGDAAYVTCRAQLDAARTQAQATAIAGINAGTPSYQAPSQAPIQMPVWGR